MRASSLDLTARARTRARARPRARARAETDRQTDKQTDGRMDGWTVSALLEIQREIRTRLWWLSRPLWPGLGRRQQHHYEGYSPPPTSQRSSRLPVTKDIHLANTLRTLFPPRLLALALGVWLGPESPERLSRWNTF